MPPAGSVYGASPPALSHHTFKVDGEWLKMCKASDLHIGAAGFNEAGFIADRDSCLRERRRMSINGDVFDGIVTADKKRYEPSALHPRLHGENDILGQSVNWAVELLEPLAQEDLLDYISIGNHDTSIRKHHNADLVAQLVTRLTREVKGCRVKLGAYAGTAYYPCPKGGRGFLEFAWHGAGGGGMGSWVGQFGSKATWVEGADLVWFAHLHNLAISCDRRYGPELSKQGVPTGRLVSRDRWLVRTPSYLDAYATMTYGSEALYSPSPTGCVRVDVHRPTGQSFVTAGAPPQAPEAKRQTSKRRG